MYIYIQIFGYKYMCVCSCDVRAWEHVSIYARACACV